MPFANEHACRIAPPDAFKKGSFRRISQGKLDIIIGRKKGKKTTSTQAFRYPVKDWSIAEARKHCSENKGSFEAAKKQKLSDKFKHIKMLDEVAGVGGSTTLSTIEVLRTGNIVDRDLAITDEMLNDFVRNFEDNIYGTELQINLGHDRGGEAAGWIKGLTKVGNKLLAAVEWTELGISKIKKKLYRFTSSEFALSFPHPDNGKLVKNVFMGVALTNIPAVRGLAPVSLSEEMSLSIENNTFSMEEIKRLYEELNAKDKVSFNEFHQFKNLVTALNKAGEATKMLTELEEKTEDAPEEPEGEASEDEKPEGEESAEEAPAEETPEGEESKEEADEDEGESSEELNEETPEEEPKEEAEEEPKEEEEKEDEDKEEEEEPEEPSDDEPAPTGESGEPEQTLTATEEVTALKEENKKLKLQVELTELTEKVETDFCLSQTRKVGFVKDKKVVSKVATFLAGLSQAQRESFSEILSKVQTVDLSVRGSASTHTAKEATEDNIVSLANELMNTGKVKEVDAAIAQKIATQMLKENKSFEQIRVDYKLA